jgi:hypothetical protein
VRTTEVSGVYSFTHVPLGLKTYVPTGWETVHTGTAWLALGTALPEHTWDWLYPGASDWLSPDDAASVLQSYVRLGAKNLDDLPRWLVRRLRAMGLTHLLRPAIKADPGPQARAQQRAAESMLQSLRAEDSPSPWELHEAILGASETLLRALAGGELPAFGWPGSAKPEPVTTPRQRIALEILQGPVSLGPRGLMPCLPGEEPAEPFFCDLRFPAEGLLKLRPAQSP